MPINQKLLIPLIVALCIIVAAIILIVPKETLKEETLSQGDVLFFFLDKNDGFNEVPTSFPFGVVKDLRFGVIQNVSDKKEYVVEVTLLNMSPRKNGFGYDVYDGMYLDRVNITALRNRITPDYTKLLVNSEGFTAIHCALYENSVPDESLEFLDRVNRSVRTIAIPLDYEEYFKEKYASNQSVEDVVRQSAPLPV